MTTYKTTGILHFSLAKQQKVSYNVHMANIIEETLKANIKKLDNRFVFPTQMAADLWADRATLTCGVSAVAMERFIAWDDFKNTSIKSKQKDKKAVPSVMRSVFSTLLLEHNKTEKFLTKIIGQDFAQEAAGFANWITSLLPSLCLWKKHFDHSGTEPDAEDKDYLEIYSRYLNFLNENSFFDPAWETPPFKSDGSHYFVFFPEILTDYAEYKEILETTKDVTIVSMPEEMLPSIEETDRLPEVSFYSNSRTELKNLAMTLRKLNEEKNIPWDQIAISVPDIESYGRYIERELELFRIPCVIRFARPLNATGAGNFFAQIAECVNSRFAFDSVRDLLLNLELPWKDKESINQLIEFGKENNCICSYTCDGKEVDVWEESFKTTNKEERASGFYKSLKKRLTALTDAKTFSDIREEYFKFREFAFDMEQCAPSADKIISRCISELAGLIDIENEYPQYKLPSAYNFYTQYLTTVKYLEQTDNLGVRILPYKTGACAPFACHIIVDASQSSLSIVYKPLSFLREDKRKHLFKDREDPNVTEHFIMLYNMNSFSGINIWTASAKTFTGYAQACSYLNEKEVKNGEQALSFYDKERAWLKDSAANSEAQPQELADTAIEGFNFWKECQNYSDVSDSDNAKENAVNTSVIKDRIKEKFKDYEHKEKIRISASGLKKFYSCPRKWVENYLAGLDEPVNEATLIDDFAEGRLNHKILELYFSGLKAQKLSIHTTEKGLEPQYAQILKDAVDKAIEAETRKSGSEYTGKDKGNSFIATELINTTKERLLADMTKTIEAFSRQFEGFTILYTEERLTHQEENYVFVGDVDLVLSNDYEIFIIDYKKSKTPDLLYDDGTVRIKTSDDDDDEDNNDDNEKDEDSCNVPDFQMPAYLYLLEKDKGIKAENCAFFSLKDNELVPVVGEKVFAIYKAIHSRTQKEVYTRETFEPTMKIFHQKKEEFYERLQNLDFSVNEQDQDFDICNKCTFRAFCRRVFNISHKD